MIVALAALSSRELYRLVVFFLCFFFFFFFCFPLVFVFFFFFCNFFCNDPGTVRAKLRSVLGLYSPDLQVVYNFNYI